MFLINQLAGTLLPMLEFDQLITAHLRVLLFPLVSAASYELAYYVQIETV